MRKTSEPAFTLPVSEQEKEVAESLRKEFEDMLKELERFSTYLLVFFDHVDDLEGSEDMSSISPLLKRYEKKLKTKFNSFMVQLEDGLHHYNDGFSDTELDNIRDLIIENTKNMRKGLIELMRAFGKAGDPDFLGNAKDAYAVIASAIDQVRFLIREELFTHIDYDILGRIRLGVAQAPLVIRGSNGI